jgi:hypothetical protein
MNAQTKPVYSISTSPESNLASHLFLTAITRTDGTMELDIANQAEKVHVQIS